MDVVVLRAKGGVSHEFAACRKVSPGEKKRLTQSLCHIILTESKPF